MIDLRLMSDLFPSNE